MLPQNKTDANSESLVCTYCKVRLQAKEADLPTSRSDDHIFPQFLGGKETVTSCKRCNNTFGHDFEAAVKKSFSPFAVALSLCGVKPARLSVWKDAHTDPKTGMQYDMDTNKDMVLSKPHIAKDNLGNVVAAHFRTTREARRFLKKHPANRSGQRLDVQLITKAGLQPKLNMPNLVLDTNMRRLAVKMCIGLAAYSGQIGSCVSEGAVQYLSGNNSTCAPPSIAYARYPTLDALRPPLSHLVYIEGDPSSGRCYGIVQYYGTIQFYVLLNQDYHEPPFALAGILNAVDFTEKIWEVEPLLLPPIPAQVQQLSYAAGILSWETSMNDQVRKLYGTNPMVFSLGGQVMQNEAMAATLQLKRPNSATQTSDTYILPVVWNEYLPELNFSLSLEPDRINETDLTLPQNANEMTFSYDSGVTTFSVTSDFLNKWKSGELDRSLGGARTWSPQYEGLRLHLGLDYWCPVEVSGSYTVKRRSWLGTIELPELRTSATADPNVIVAIAKLLIPERRPEDWIEVNNPEELLQSNQGMLGTIDVYDAEITMAVTGQPQ